MSVCSMFYQPVQLVCSQAMPDGIRSWHTPRSRGGSSEVDDLWNPQEMWAEGKGGCSWCSVAVLGRTVRIWVWGERE